MSCNTSCHACACDFAIDIPWPISLQKAVGHGKYTFYSLRMNIRWNRENGAFFFFLFFCIGLHEFLHPNSIQQSDAHKDISSQLQLPACNNNNFQEIWSIYTGCQKMVLWWYCYDCWVWPSREALQTAMQQICRYHLPHHLVVRSDHLTKQQNIIDSWASYLCETTLNKHEGSSSQDKRGGSQSQQSMWL